MEAAITPVAGTVARLAIPAPSRWRRGSAASWGESGGGWPRAEKPPFVRNR